jgi:hypothetical protein
VSAGFTERELRCRIDNEQQWNAAGSSTEMRLPDIQARKSTGIKPVIERNSRIVTFFEAGHLHAQTLDMVLI